MQQSLDHPNIVKIYEVFVKKETIHLFTIFNNNNKINKYINYTFSF